MMKRRGFLSRIPLMLGLAASPKLFAEATEPEPDLPNDLYFCKDEAAAHRHGREPIRVFVRYRDPDTGRLLSDDDAYLLGRESEAWTFGPLAPSFTVPLHTSRPRNWRVVPSEGEFFPSPVDRHYEVRQAEFVNAGFVYRQHPHEYRMHSLPLYEEAARDVVSPEFIGGTGLKPGYYQLGWLTK